MIDKFYFQSNGSNIETLNKMQLNILAVALDHMREHLVSLKLEDSGENELIEERIQALTDMQTLLEI